MLRKTLPLYLLMIIIGLTACKSNKNENTEEPTTEVTSTTFGGLQLYTLRDTMASNPKDVLKAVADMGYKYIEVAGYKEGKFYGMTPQEFKDYCAEIELEPVSSHHGDVSVENVDSICNDLNRVGFQYLVIPIPPMGAFSYNQEEQKMMIDDDTEKVMKNINEIAAHCYDKGIMCLYHNHDMEFRENSKGIVPMQYFIENSNPRHLNFEYDMYWISYANEDPVEWLEKAPGRVLAWHVKDMDTEENDRRFAPVGEGTIDYTTIWQNRELSGMKYYFVEQDRCFNHTPLEAVKISHDNLTGLGFR